MAPWKLPLLIAAIAVPIVFAFYLGGPGVGLAMGALAAVTIVVAAARQRPRGAIEPRERAGRRVLVVLAEPLEDPATIEQVATAVQGEDAGEVLLLSPVRIGFLDRWASDVEGARRDAQRRLVISVAALAAAGVKAEARVGDEDLVQAVEDQLGSFPATEVILVSADREHGEAAAAADELRTRLRVGFRWLVSGPADR